MDVNTTTNTRIIEITVEDSDPYEAKRLADAIREAAAEKIASVMDIDSVNLLEEGNIPQSPSSPQVGKITVIGIAVGFIISVGIVIINFLLNDRICTPDDVERYLGLSTLGSIPLDVEKEEQYRRNQKLKKKMERRKGRTKNRKSSAHTTSDKKR